MDILVAEQLFSKNKTLVCQDKRDQATKKRTKKRLNAHGVYRKIDFEVSALDRVRFAMTCLFTIRGIYGFCCDP